MTAKTQTQINRELGAMRKVYLALAALCDEQRQRVVCALRILYRLDP